MAKIARVNSFPPETPLKDLKSFKKNTHITPVLNITSNRDKPEANEGSGGYSFSEPEIPDKQAAEEKQAAQKTQVAEKLKAIGVCEYKIRKVMREFTPERIWRVTRNFEQDMRGKHHVEDFAAVLVWRILNGVDSCDSWGPDSADSWVSDVQQEFDESARSDRTLLLGVVEVAAIEQKLEVQQVMSRLDLHGISHHDMQKWAQIDLRIEP
ncbi:hypothetical protein ES702_03188 [subsurface metagenome]